MGGAENPEYPAQRPRAVEGFLQGKCGGADCYVAPTNAVKLATPETDEKPHCTATATRSRLCRLLAAFAARMVRGTRRVPRYSQSEARSPHRRRTNRVLRDHPRIRSCDRPRASRPSPADCVSRFRKPRHAAVSKLRYSSTGRAISSKPSVTPLRKTSRDVRREMNSRQHAPANDFQTVTETVNPLSLRLESSQDEKTAFPRSASSGCSATSGAVARSSSSRGSTRRSTSAWDRRPSSAT